ncbi:MAG: primase-helicase family protein [Pseudomonadales bacterium]|mgnify:CR=1 FL=1
MVSSIMNLKAVNGLVVLQERFALSTIGGVVRVIDIEEVRKIRSGVDGVTLSLYKREDATVLMKRVLEEAAVVTKPKDDIENFFVNPNTRVYRSTCFNPHDEDDDELNLWSNPPIISQTGDWSLIKAHLIDVVCDSCPVKSNYLIKFLAHMLQRPSEKPGVMIVLMGRQGTGKGALLQIVQRIWQGTSIFTADVDHVAGRFTGVLERNFVVLLDEALFKGNKKAIDRMKSLITEPRCQIEEKNQPSRSIKSIHRFFATTNHDQFGQTEIDDRRHAFFRVSDGKQGDGQYFDKLFEAIADDKVIAAMMHDLKALDLTGFKVRVAPRSDDHGAQILKSLTGLDRYWYHLLSLGDIPGLSGGSSNWDSESLFVSTKYLLECYRDYNPMYKKFEQPTLQEVNQMIRARCPSARPERSSEFGRQRRGYVIPELGVARKEFEEVLRIAIRWE